MSDLREILQEMREEQESSDSTKQDIINALIEEHNKERNRADLLQANLDIVKKFYFNEVGLLQAEIARLKLKVKH